MTENYILGFVLLWLFYIIVSTGISEHLGDDWFFNKIKEWYWND